MLALFLYSYATFSVAVACVLVFMVIFRRFFAMFFKNNHCVCFLWFLRTFRIINEVKRKVISYGF